MNKKIFLFGAIFTLFLFCIDEGYYDFRWMRNIGNWIAFVPYLLLSYLLFSGINLIDKRIKKPSK